MGVQIPLCGPAVCAWGGGICALTFWGIWVAHATQSGGPGGLRGSARLGSTLNPPPLRSPPQGVCSCAVRLCWRKRAGSLWGAPRCPVGVTLEGSHRELSLQHTDPQEEPRPLCQVQVPGLRPPDPCLCPVHVRSHVYMRVCAGRAAEVQWQLQVCSESRRQPTCALLWPLR